MLLVQAQESVTMTMITTTVDLLRTSPDRLYRAFVESERFER